MKSNTLSARRLAIVVPGCTDLNRGDQALAWEAADLLREMGLASEVMLIESGEGEREREAQTRQTRERGYPLLHGLLPHPRRGRHKAGDKVQETFISLLLMALYSLLDLLRGQCLLLLAPCPWLAESLLNAGQRVTYRAFRETSCLVLKGGGFLHTYGSLQDSYYTWYSLFYLRLAQRMGKPVIVLPNSFGPLQGRLVRWQVRRVLSRCVFLSARESISAATLSDLLGVTVPVFPDMGYSLQSMKREVGEAACRQAGVPLGTQPCVAFTLRPYRFPESTNPAAAFERYLDAMAEIIRHVTAQGFHPVLVTHVSGPSAHENDRLAIEELRTRLTGIRHSWVDTTGDCREIKAIYACMGYLVGTRFHSVVFAQESGVPCIAVSYGGYKGVGIMRDMGLEDYVVPIDEVNGAGLCARFDHLRAHAQDVRARMAEWRQRLPAERERLKAGIRACLPQALRDDRAGCPCPECATHGRSDTNLPSFRQPALEDMNPATIETQKVA